MDALTAWLLGALLVPLSLKLVFRVRAIGLLGYDPKAGGASVGLIKVMTFILGFAFVLVIIDVIQDGR
jgi:hypothetical protein